MARMPHLDMPATGEQKRRKTRELGPATEKNRGGWKCLGTQAPDTVYPGLWY